MHIEIRKKDGSNFKLTVADNAGPVTSAWLHALTRKVCTLSTDVVTLMPPVCSIPLRTENTNRPFIEA
jgi:hypothetical protein